MEQDEQELFEIKDPWTRKLVIDTYFGRGPQNPSVTTRLATQEQRQTATDEKVEMIEAKLDRGFWLLVITLLSAVGSLILLVFKH